MVCVVLTGMPPKTRQRQRSRRPGLRAEAVHRPQPDQPLAHRVDDPPAARQRPQPHRRVAGQHHLERYLGRRLVTAAVRCRRSAAAKMMPIVFWASLPPWPRLYSAADSSCPRPEDLVHPARRAPAEEQRDERNHDVAEGHAEQRGHEDEQDNDPDLVPLHAAECPPWPAPPRPGRRPGRATSWSAAPCTR